MPEHGRKGHEVDTGHPRRLLLGFFHGTPMTKKSVFNLPAGPDYVVLYQKNIEAYAPPKPKSVSESGARSFTNSGTISVWTRSN